MTEPPPDSELAQRFRNMAVSSLPRAPLYGVISRTIAEDPAIYRLLSHAPPTQQLPVLLLAATHAVLLDSLDDGDGEAHELAQWYPNLTSQPRRSDDRRLPAVFAGFVGQHREQIVDLVATHHTQTNEVGRSALVLTAFGLLEAEMGPLAHLDVGASGGLNLLTDRLRYCYVRDPDEPAHEIDDDDGPALGPPARRVGAPSPVEITTHTRGAVPVPTSLPVIAARCGIDRHPIDVTDDGEARWLEACVWPDQTDRFERLRAAIAIARRDPPELLAGDAVTSLDPAVDRMRRAGHVVVTNCWVLNYLSPADRAAYVAELDRLGADVDLSWVFLESPRLTPELHWGAAPGESDLTALNLVRWRRGRRSVEHLAICHPHGYWMHWKA